MKKIIILCGVIFVQAIPAYASDDSNSGRPPMNFSNTPIRLNSSDVTQGELSKLISERNAEEDLMKAIELSKMESNGNLTNPSFSPEDDELKRVMEISEKELYEKAMLESVIKESKNLPEEDSLDEDTRRAIELSKTGFPESSDDDELLLAMQMSLVSLNNEEDSFSHHNTSTSSLNNELQSIFTTRELHHGGSFNDLYSTGNTNAVSNLTDDEELNRHLVRRRTLSEMPVTNNTNDMTVNTLNPNEDEETVETTTTISTVRQNEGTVVTPTQEERRRLALEAFARRSNQDTNQ